MTLNWRVLHCSVILRKPTKYYVNTPFGFCSGINSLLLFPLFTTLVVCQNEENLLFARTLRTSLKFIKQQNH